MTVRTYGADLPDGNYSEYPIQELNQKITEYHESRWDIVASVAFACLGIIGVGVCLGLSLVTVAPYIFTLYVAFAVIGALGVAHRVHKMQDLNKKIEEVVRDQGLVCFVWKSECIKDEEISAEEFSRMRAHLDRSFVSDRGISDSARIRYQVTLDATFSGLFSARPIAVETREVESNLSSIQEKYRPWRNLLRDMVHPDNQGKFTDLHFFLIGKMATDHYQSTKDNLNRLDLTSRTDRMYSYQIQWNGNDQPDRIIAHKLTDPTDNVIQYNSMAGFKRVHFGERLGIQFAESEAAV